MNDLFANSSFYLVLGSLFIAALFVGIVLFVIFSLNKRRSNLSARLDQIEAPIPQMSTNPAKPRIIGREINGSLFSRTLASWVNQVILFFGKFTPAKSLADLEHKLGIAGHPYNLHARQFSVLRFFLLLVGVFIAFLVIRSSVTFDSTTLLFGVLIIFLFYALPITWLNGRVRTRQAQIQRDLPDALDMLAVCASAGLGFDQSVQKISDYWQTELGKEFTTMRTEMELGASRTEALKNMSKRVDVSDLSQFIAIITQAEKVGMSYADVLQSQSIQMRILRQHRVRESVNKLPAKMIVPLALLIFPAILAVILVPLIPQLMNIFK
ncbi:MAG: type II secretion system F family protein [Anaerolineaceae bacterium]|jgi:tight adherence protein C